MEFRRVLFRSMENLQNASTAATRAWETQLNTDFPNFFKNWGMGSRSEEHTSELQSLRHLVCRLLLEKKMKRDRHRADDFTQMVFHLHRDDDEALANYLDLSERRAVLDAGGGSGVMAIVFFFNNTAPPEFYLLSLPVALPI